MSESVLALGRGVRRRLRKVVQNPGEANYGRRAHAILLLWESGGFVSGVADTLCAARSSVNRWRALFEQYGEDGLRPQPRGRTDYKATEAVLTNLMRLVEQTPQDYGYLRSRWSSELLAVELSRQLNIQVHATTVRRWLARQQYGYRRARPTLHIRDPRKAERMRAIQQTLAHRQPGTEVFYSDEVDIDLNPKIGATWTRRGHQRTISTPGKNQKRYLAGALHARTGKVLWSEGPSKNTDLFLTLLEHLRAHYRSARRIVLIVDNYCIHKSRLTLAWLKHNPKFNLLFQPTYHPWVNLIERLWKQLHDVVTRNHCHTLMNDLMRGVRTFMRVVQPFPGADYANAKLE
jgi:transposase